VTWGTVGNDILDRDHLLYKVTDKIGNDRSEFIFYSTMITTKLCNDDNDVETGSSVRTDHSLAQLLLMLVDERTLKAPSVRFAS
jgi:hypothetical protein